MPGSPTGTCRPTWSSRTAAAAARPQPVVASRPARPVPAPDQAWAQQAWTGPNRPPGMLPGWSPPTQARAYQAPMTPGNTPNRMGPGAPGRSWACPSCAGLRSVGRSSCSRLPTGPPIGPPTGPPTGAMAGVPDSSCANGSDRAGPRPRQPRRTWPLGSPADWASASWPPCPIACAPCFPPGEGRGTVPLLGPWPQQSRPRESRPTP